MFLDRDGVLVVPEFRDGRSYAVRRLEDFRIYEGAAEAVRALDAAGWTVVVATNQPDIANGLVAQDTVDAMHGTLQRAMPLAAIETCPHAQDAGCACRKPRPGMLTRAAERLGLDLPASIMVGDRASDIEAGAAAGCRTVFVDRGYDPPTRALPDRRVDGIAAAVRWILSAPAATA
ncbi:MAG: HAD family hydrolase [Rhodospirillales bacterium]|nr:HAD family hydrolase [Rhodospirillales bacterium]